MKYLLLPLLLLPALLMSLLPSTGDQEVANQETLAAPMTDAPPATGPVVLELFTSQGCSSCPSADALLQELDAKEEDVIALSFHVDYWNYLGWEDPFSSPYFSARQTDYTDVLQVRTYTPQLVVNGQKAMIGSRRGEVSQAVNAARRAALTHQPTISAQRKGKRIAVTYQLDEAPANTRVTGLLIQPEATSSINRGENRGRELHHVNVVRAMQHQEAALSGALALEVPEGLEATDLKVVLLVQDTRSQAILGVARED